MSTPDWLNDPSFQSLDPSVRNAFQQAGLTPSTTRGTGFADVPYWTGVGPSQTNRWVADILGQGTDQPTGTPGSGVWQNSGQNAPPPSPNTTQPAGQPTLPSGPTVPSATSGASTAQQNINDILQLNPYQQFFRSELMNQMQGG